MWVIKEKILAFSLSLLFLSTESMAASIDPSSSQTSRLRVTNRCPDTIWVQSTIGGNPSPAAKAGVPVVVQVPQNQSYDYTIPDEGLASTRFWPKKGCNQYGFDCQVGESTSNKEAQVQKWQSVTKPFAPDINSKFEATWGCRTGGNAQAPCAPNPSDPAQPLGSETWWNGSVVDGFTLPYEVVVKNHQGSCRDLQTGKVLESPGVNCSGLNAATMCPESTDLSTSNCQGQTGDACKKVNGINLIGVNLQWKDSEQKVVGCFSPCSKLTTAQGSDNGSTAGGWKYVLGGVDPTSAVAKWYCCPPGVKNTDCTAWHQQHPIQYEENIHQAQCNSYTYAYDDEKGLAVCSSETRFEVVFCPPPGGTSQSADNTETTPVTAVAQLKAIVPTSMVALLDGTVIQNDQMLSIKSGASVGIQGQLNKGCVLRVDANGIVSTQTGELCTSIKIDNANKTLTFLAAPTPTQGFSFQFNYNTSVGISAFFNAQPVSNAQVLNSSAFPASSTLKASQGTKWGACQLSLMDKTVTKGSGEMCNRLNIVKTPEVVHIYLPADIPNNSTPVDTTAGGATPTAAVEHFVVFGMNQSFRADFLNNSVYDKSKISLKELANVQINLIAYEGSKMASCIISKSGDTLTVVPNSGPLCQGLILSRTAEGDYYIGLPDPLPQSTGTKSYTLGIAQGMSIIVEGKTYLWNSADKSVVLKTGTTTSIQIVGNNRTTRTCSISVSTAGGLTVNTSESGCAGVVENGGVLYFPAF